MRLHAQLSLQRVDAQPILAERLAAPALPLEEPHQLPVDRLPCRIEGEDPHRRPDRRPRGPGADLNVQQPGQGLNTQLAEALPLAERLRDVMAGEEDRLMRLRRLAIVVGSIACVLGSTCGESLAQKSRIYEFGPDALEFLPRDGTAKGTRPLPVPVEPGAGGWRPLILASGRELRLPPPPDDRSTAAELRELRKLVAGDDAAAIERVRYWDLGSPAYRWNELLAEIGARDHVGSAAGIRAFALLNVAIHDALIAAWDSKYAYNRPRPGELDGRLAPEVRVPRSPSYPCEQAVAAGAAAAVLAHLFPEDAERPAAAAEEAAWSRVVAGAVYPSDARAGLALGRAVAARVIEYARTDDADRGIGRPVGAAPIAQPRRDGGE